MTEPKDPAPPEQSAHATPSVPKPVESKDEHVLFRQLRQLGAICSIHSAIGILGALLGATIPSMAAVSLLLIAATYTFIYRTRIRARIRSDWLCYVILAFIASLAVFRDYFGHLLGGSGLTRATGIIAYYNHAQEFLPRIRDLIQSCRHEMWLVGANFYVTVPNNEEIIKKALDRGVVVRFLLLNPESPNLPAIANGFNQPEKDLRSECELTLSRLDGIARYAAQQRSSGTLEVKLVDDAPKARLYAFDPSDTEEGRTFFVPHVDHSNTPDLPGFLANHAETGVAAPFHKGMRDLWKQAKERRPG